MFLICSHVSTLITEWVHIKFKSRYFLQILFRNRIILFFKTTPRILFFPKHASFHYTNFYNCLSFPAFLDHCCHFCFLLALSAVTASHAIWASSFFFYGWKLKAPERGSNKKQKTTKMHQPQAKPHHIPFEYVLFVWLPFVNMYVNFKIFSLGLFWLV